MARLKCSQGGRRKQKNRDGFLTGGHGDVEGRTRLLRLSATPLRMPSPLISAGISARRSAGASTQMTPLDSFCGVLRQGSF